MSARFWNGVASNSDGSILLACDAEAEGGVGRLDMSTDYGNTWVEWMRINRSFS